MRCHPRFLGLLGLFALTACGDDLAMPQPFWAAAPTPRADAGTALVEARRCGRAIAVAARCNYVRDDRDVAALRYAVLQGLGQRHGDVVDQSRLTEAVDLAVLDRMATIGRCAVDPVDVPVMESGLRDVIGSCAAP